MYGSIRNLVSNYLYNPLTFYIDSAHDFGADRNPLLDSLVMDIAFYGGTCYTCEECLSGAINCSVLGSLGDLVRRYRASCEELLTDCHWQHQPIDCCQLFRPLDTEFGRCYGVNVRNSMIGGGGTTEQQGPPPSMLPPLISNRQTGPGRLEFRVLEDVQLYLHDEYGVPHAYIDRTLRETILWGMRKEVVVRVIEIENRDAVAELSVERRNCRFPWELAPDRAAQLYSYYSFSACAVECFARTQRYYCNCTHHLMPRDATGMAGECSLDGLACLTKHSVEIAQERKRCPCLASCVEPEFFVIHKSEEYFPEDEQEARVTVRLLSLPYERFVRNIAKTEMDLFIALGGFMGLFFGASLLTATDFLLNLWWVRPRRFQVRHGAA
uniref:Uncharacterized protein n=1 Tax=Anopheles albimanus TaxID=7167 RepID=A0A182FMG4_ANOAL